MANKPRILWLALVGFLLLAAQAPWLAEHVRLQYPTSWPAPELARGISLSPENKVDLISFLLTLTDREFLFNPNFGFPRK